MGRGRHAWLQVPSRTGSAAQRTPNFSLSCSAWVPAKYTSKAVFSRMFALITDAEVSRTAHPELLVELLDVGGGRRSLLLVVRVDARAVLGAHIATLQQIEDSPDGQDQEKIARPTAGSGGLTVAAHDGGHSGCHLDSNSISAARQADIGTQAGLLLLLPRPPPTLPPQPPLLLPLLPPPPLPLSLLQRTWRLSCVGLWMEENVFSSCS